MLHASRRFQHLSVSNEDIGIPVAGDEEARAVRAQCSLTQKGEGKFLSRHVGFQTNMARLNVHVCIFIRQRLFDRCSALMVKPVAMLVFACRGCAWLSPHGFGPDPRNKEALGSLAPSIIIM